MRVFITRRIKGWMPPKPQRWIRHYACSKRAYSLEEQTAIQKTSWHFNIGICPLSILGTLNLTKRSSCNYMYLLRQQHFLVFHFCSSLKITYFWVTSARWKNRPSFPQRSIKLTTKYRPRSKKSGIKTGRKIHRIFPTLASSLPWHSVVWLDKAPNFQPLPWKGRKSMEYASNILAFQGAAWGTGFYLAWSGALKGMMVYSGCQVVDLWEQTRTLWLFRAPENPCALLVRMWNGAAIMENSMEVTQKLNKLLPYKSGNPTARYIFKIIESRILKRHLHTHVHCSVIHNSQEVETT